jgi:hypothetical protein
MESEEFHPIHFFEEPIEVFYFGSRPFLEKTPICPDGFSWRGNHINIKKTISEWRDYERRGRYARNMQPQHAAVAKIRGSWGVGRFYFRVLTDQGAVYDIYYDRSPKNVDERKGAWFIYQELGSLSD